MQNVGFRWVGRVGLIGLAMTLLIAGAMVIGKSVALSAGTAAVDPRGTMMVYVPAGCFMMGNDPAKDSQAQPDEQPQFKMCFANGFWIDKTDVTNAAYNQFINAGGYERQGTWWTDAGWQWLQSENSQGTTHPVD